MRLCQLIYTSRPFGFNAPMLDDILTTARALNAQHDVTGALMTGSALLVDGGWTAD